MSERRIDFAEAMESQLVMAREEGVVGPTLLLLDPASAAARAIYEELRGKPLLPTRHGDEEYAPLERVSSEAAQRLLRRHAGEGGDAVARHLVTTAYGQDYWLVLVLPGQIAYRAVKDHEALGGGQVPYDRVPRRLRQTPEDILSDDGPSMLTLLDSGGRQVRVCGPTGADAVFAGVLVAMATTCPGWADLPDPETGEPLRVWVTEDFVVDFLAKVYGQLPVAVAEAVMALRKADGKKAAWLERLLRNRPSLKSLSGRVRHELTGL